MRGLFLILFFVFGCSTDRVSVNRNRLPANDQGIAISSEIDLSQTTLKIFPPEIESHYFKFHFYFETRNIHHQFIDFNPEDLKIVSHRKKILKFDLQKIAVGKYYLNFRHAINGSELGLSFFLRNKLIYNLPRFSLSLVDRSRSWVKSLGMIQDGLRLRLFLSDADGREIKTLVPPEIMVSGEAEVIDLRQIAGGLWEFTLIYPNYNQIIYLSVRTQGSFIGQMYRLRHIEK